MFLQIISNSKPLSIIQLMAINRVQKWPVHLISQSYIRKTNQPSPSRRAINLLWHFRRRWARRPHLMHDGTNLGDVIFGAARRGTTTTLLGSQNKSLKGKKMRKWKSISSGVASEMNEQAKKSVSVAVGWKTDQHFSNLSYTIINHTDVLWELVCTRGKY